jgi:hypothetical protein
MHTFPRSRPIHPFVLAAALSVAACHGSSDVVVTKPPVPVYLEIEQNDDACSANDFGLLAAGVQLGIEGSVRDDGYDPQDGFEFTAYGAIAVEFTLTADCPCADLDVWIYDPIADAFVGVFDSPYDPEQGHLTVFGQPFHLVVVSASGDAHYRLDVRTSPVYAATEGGSEALVLSRTEAGANTSPKLAPAPADYLRSARRTGPPAVSEVFVIDPTRGVVARGWIPLAD